MRILSLCYEFPPIGGGGAKVVRGLDAALAAGGHQVELVTMGFAGLPREEEVDGIRVHRARCLRRKEFHCTAPEAATYAASALPLARRLAAGNRPDVVHAHFIFPDGALAWALRRLTGCRYLVTAHGSDVPGYNPHRLKSAHRVLSPLWSSVTGRAERIVCPSESLRELVAARGRGDRTAVVPNGIDPGLYDPGKVRNGRLLAVSRMLERKGFQHVLEALAALPRPVGIDIVGDGPYLGELKRRAAALGVDARFAGWVDAGSPRLREFYETSAIFVFPSEAENFPIVLLEAMAAGMAIVTSAGTGCAEVVGETARLVPAGDPAAIREALVSLLGDPALCAEMGRAARARVDALFGWRRVAARYEEIYRDVAGAARGPREEVR